jgi:hypothetical protein
VFLEYEAAPRSQVTDLDGHVGLREYFEALRHADDRLREADIRFASERDRRYTEIRHEQEKALRIKDEADKIALDLARQIQTYKDEKANELREQISRERGLYITQDQHDAVIQRFEDEIHPLAQFVAAQTGIGLSRRFDITQVIQVFAVLAALAAVIVLAIVR